VHATIQPLRETSGEPGNPFARRYVIARAFPIWRLFLDCLHPPRHRLERFAARDRTCAKRRSSSLRGNKVSEQRKSETGRRRRQRSLHQKAVIGGHGDEFVDLAKVIR
jgi:hypothetical protein